MVKKLVKINLSTGLEARPVAQLVQLANRYECEIYMEAGDRRVNAKSIMGMMALGLDTGEEIAVTAEGKGEEEAIQRVERYLSGE